MFHSGFVFGEQEGAGEDNTTGISGAATTITPPTGASLMSPFGVAHDDSTATFFHGATDPRAESRESWSAFGRFASSGSVVSQSMLGTNSVSIATTQSASGLRVTAATSFDATGTGSLLSPSGPSLPKIGSAAYSSARTIAKKRSVMLLNVDPLPLPSPRGDVVEVSESSPRAEALLPALGAPHHRDTSPVPVEFRSHSGSKAEPRGGGSSRGKMSISRRSSLPRAPSPIIVIPVSLGPTDSLVALLDPTSHESPMLFSPAIPGWSEDTDPKALVDFSASITREPLNMSTRADKTRVRSLSILGLTAQQQVNDKETSVDDAPPGLNLSSLRHSTSMSLSTRLLRDTLVDLEVLARTSMWAEEVDEWLVITIQCDMNQQYLEDTFGVSFAVEKVATPPPLVVQSLDEGELAPTDVTPASPCIVTLLSEVEFVDEVVGRTEVEVYERMEFAPLLAEYTKSLMRAALRGVGNPERKSKKRIAGVAHLRVKGNRGQYAPDTMM
ncbi:Hypothetical protein, putative [Bodo saltans]|uniref:Uncharacterized protein n=1 Tax=Bodo saltans TaxID=75058 RepID=A0A0S4JG77_BODSA|nr:Hypothetical protein, putative [Bodo saltans]|eukprot:CUG89139.1 Hypothetical protein, putative [Bodo saltans]